MSKRSSFHKKWKSVYFFEIHNFEDERSLVDIDQLPNVSSQFFFIRWTQLFLFIGPEFDHCCHWFTPWLTDSLTHSCLANLINVTLACEDSNSKLVEVVLLLKLMMGNMPTTVWCRFGRLTLVIKLSFCPDFEMGFQGLLRFWSWCSGKILELCRRCNQRSGLKKQWLHATWKLSTFTRMLD